MKAILTVPSKDFSIDLTNTTVDQYRMIDRRSSPDIPMVVESFPVGKSITLITSNMPLDLKEAINNMIREYCGH